VPQVLLKLKFHGHRANCHGSVARYVKHKADDGTCNCSASQCPLDDAHVVQYCLHWQSMETIAPRNFRKPPPQWMLTGAMVCNINASTRRQQHTLCRKESPWGSSWSHPRTPAATAAQLGRLIATHKHTHTHTLTHKYTPGSCSNQGTKSLYNCGRKSLWGGHNMRMNDPSSCIHL